MRYDYLIESMREGLINKTAPFNIQVFYDIELNRFTDVFDEDIINIFELLTPNDIYMFKQDSRNNEFCHREFPNLTIRIMEA